MRFLTSLVVLAAVASTGFATDPPPVHSFTPDPPPLERRVSDLERKVQNLERAVGMRNPVPQQMPATRGSTIPTTLTVIAGDKCGCHLGIGNCGSPNCPSNGGAGGCPCDQAIIREGVRGIDGVPQWNFPTRPAAPGVAVTAPFDPWGPYKGPGPFPGTLPPYTTSGTTVRTVEGVSTYRPVRGTHLHRCSAGHVWYH
jgi:hypothetical protein